MLKKFDIMCTLEFEYAFPIDYQLLIPILTDYEGYVEFLPSQLKSVRILEKNDVQVKTEEVIRFSSIVKNEIIQHCIHKNINNLKLITEIISGPAKNSEIIMDVFPTQNETIIRVSVKLKLSIKAKILEPLIKKYFKTTIMAVFRRIHSKIEKIN